jgi:hypothetical protein
MLMPFPSRSAAALAARDARDNSLYQGHAKVTGAISALAALKRSLGDRLPLAEAESAMDDIGDHLDAIGGKLARALAVFDAAITEIEEAAL